MPEWRHSPLHIFPEAGVYMVTAATYRKEALFDGVERLDLLCDTLLELADGYGWQLQAWAVFNNHYHFIASSPKEPGNLSMLINHLHASTARAINKLDDVRGRKVWFQFWDTHLTFERAYYARLNYVHNNPVHHALVDDARIYPWCSADGFERQAERAYFEMISSMPLDRLNVADNF